MPISVGHLYKYFVKITGWHFRRRGEYMSFFIEDVLTGCSQSSSSSLLDCSLILSRLEHDILNVYACQINRPMHVGLLHPPKVRINEKKNLELFKQLTLLPLWIQVLVEDALSPRWHNARSGRRKCDGVIAGLLIEDSVPYASRVYHGCEGSAISFFSLDI